MFPAKRRINNFDVAGFSDLYTHFGWSSGFTARFVSTQTSAGGRFPVGNWKIWKMASLCEQLLSCV
jgi:hypothetical protein